MDFSSQLSNLQRTADAAQNRNRRSPPRSGHYSRGDRGGGRHSPPRQDHARRYSPPRKKPRQYRNPKWNHLASALSNLQRYEVDSKDLPVCKHLCLLAITITDLPMEDIWRRWVQDAPQDMTISLIGHSKHPQSVKSDWYKNHLLIHRPRIGRGRDFAPPEYRSRKPEWGSIEITRAMLDLCVEATRIGKPQDHDVKADPRFSLDRYGFQDTIQELPPVDKIIFISETCLPIASFAQSLDHIQAPKSWINHRDTPNNGYSRQLQFEKVHNVIHTVYKADQWMMLTMSHVRAILDLLPPTLWQCFQHCNASDELYFPTASNMLQFLRNEDHVLKRRITYADWSTSAKNPSTFTSTDLSKVIATAREEGCIFARKFDHVSLEDWETMVLPSSNEDAE